MICASAGHHAAIIAVHGENRECAWGQGTVRLPASRKRTQPVDPARAFARGFAGPRLLFLFALAARRVACYPDASCESLFSCGLALGLSIVSQSVEVRTPPYGRAGGRRVARCGRTCYVFKGLRA